MTQALCGLYMTRNLTQTARMCQKMEYLTIMLRLYYMGKLLIVRPPQRKNPCF